MTPETNAHTHKTKHSWHVQFSGPHKFSQLDLISDPHAKKNGI